MPTDPVYQKKQKWMLLYKHLITGQQGKMKTTAFTRKYKRILRSETKKNEL